MHINSIYAAYTAYMLFGNIIMISNGVTSMKMGIYIYVCIFEDIPCSYYVLEIYFIKYINSIYTGI